MSLLLSLFYVSECMGAVDCEWCEYEPNALSLHKHPHCSTQRVCFGGVLGAKSPYNDHLPYTGKHIIHSVSYAENHVADDSLLTGRSVCRPQSKVLIVRHAISALVKHSDFICQLNFILLNLKQVSSLVKPNTANRKNFISVRC